MGAAVCRTLAIAGAHIVALDVLPCDETAADVERAGSRFLTMSVDVTDR